jgi:hypothetical protein
VKSVFNLNLLYGTRVQVNLVCVCYWNSATCRSLDRAGIRAHFKVSFNAQGMAYTVADSADIRVEMNVARDPCFQFPTTLRISENDTSPAILHSDILII